MEEVSGIRGKKVKDSPLRMTVTAGGDIASGLVEKNSARGDSVNDAPIDTDLVYFAYAGGKSADKAAVD
jgi:hypothetical protein